MYSTFKSSIKIIILMVIISQSSAFSQMSNGGYSEPWLSRNVGARPIGMGGVYSAVVNEPMGIFYNPAAPAFMPSTPTINTSVGSLGFGRTHATLAYSQEILPSFGIGIGVNNLYSGSFTGRNIRGIPTRELNSNQIAVQAATAYRLEFVSMGAAVKYINNSLNGANLSASGYAFDLGMKMNVLDIFSFGLSMNNIGGTMKWNSTSGVTENIPYTIRTGIAAEFGINDETILTRTSITGEEEAVYLPPTRYLLLGFDIVLNQYDLTPSFILGAEIVPHEFIAVRGGLSIYGDRNGEAQFFPMNNWGTGISLRPELELDFNVQLDYSLSNDYMSQSRLSHHVSLIFEL